MSTQKFDHHTVWRTFLQENGLHGLINVPMQQFDKIDDKDLRLRLINAKQIIEGLLKELNLV